jgi:hypothetical protein
MVLGTLLLISLHTSSWSPLIHAPKSANTSRI